MNQAICIMGDVEGDWKSMMELINEDRPDMVFQVGVAVIGQIGRSISTPGKCTRIRCRFIFAMEIMRTIKTCENFVNSRVYQPLSQSALIYIICHGAVS